MTRVYLSTTVDGVKVHTPAAFHFRIDLDDLHSEPGGARLVKVIAGEVVDPTPRQIEATT